MTQQSEAQVFKVAVAAGAELGERPVWDAASQAMIWVDIKSGRLHRFRTGADDEVIADLGVALGSAAPRQGGGYVLATKYGFLLTGPDGELEGQPLRPEGMTEDQQFNDGACDPVGRFWAGTTSTGLQPGAAALYRLDGHGRITRMLTGVTESNGIGWSPDGSIMYYIDSGEQPRRVRAFDYDVASGTIGGERVLICCSSEDDYPDGLVVDAEGYLWIAFWGGWQVRRYDPAGGLAEVIELPVSRPTCAGFGGPDLSELYVTSAWEELDAGQRAAEPLAGHVLRITTTALTTPARGLPVAGYCG
jgi:sugar lactone lactonase YvrE